ncbi:MAG: Gldg family protein [Myxococcota bacterium]|nr:Gldg family protein [Myxococcota bacterium]
MKSVKVIVRKELSAYFLSPVALIFLGIFLGATVCIFFTFAKFFARNLADVRPLFSWLPILLIFLVSAITMKQWSEEQKLGTLEILLTLPMRTRDLVLGKFIAGMLLVTLALVLTLPLPLTVAQLGSLDWGPVLGGYVAALLLASTYMAIGLCVSARTDNQIVALMVTLLIGGALYLVGASVFVDFFGTQVGEILRGIGTGSRFESIERGVLDFRDFFYYASLTVFFLVLNTYFLESKRMDGQPKDKESRGSSLRFGIVLTGLNVVAGNLWLAPVTSARLDLTEAQEYTISETTTEILGDLKEPLTITGYFSKTHPMLAPLIPRIRDFLREYEVRGEGIVQLSFVNPTSDEDLQAEINERFGIRSVPFKIKGRNEQSIVNSYFHILVQYGDEYKVLSFSDLIEFHADDTEVSVRLRNLEYDMTRSIRAVSQGFMSLESVLATTDTRIQITGYISPANLPRELIKIPDLIAKAAKDVSVRSGGRVTYRMVDPSRDAPLAKRLEKEYGFRPMSSDPFSKKKFWLQLLVQSGSKAFPIIPQGELGKAEVQNLIESGARRMVPGFMKTVGIVTHVQIDRTPSIPGLPKKPDQRDYQGLQAELSREFEVRHLDIKDGVVPADIDVLIVAKPPVLTPKHQYAVDQYLMRGGKVIFMTGMYQIRFENGSLQTKRVDDTVFDLLKTYGVEITDGFVMDPRNLPFPLPVPKRRGRSQMNSIEYMPYPFFPAIRQDGFSADSIIMKGLPNLAALWSSPVTLRAPVDKDGKPKLDKRGLPIIEKVEGIDADYLAWSSAESWLRIDTRLDPDFRAFPEKGFGPPPDAEIGPKPISVSLVGTFNSHFQNRPSPLSSGSNGVRALDQPGHTIQTSPADARLIVLGSSEMASDLAAELARQMTGGAFRGNPLFVRNSIDWALQNTDLLSIRSAGAFARTLKSMQPDEKSRWELGNYIVVLLALIVVLLIAMTRRNMIRPIPLEANPEEAS